MSRVSVRSTSKQWGRPAFRQVVADVTFYALRDAPAGQAGQVLASRLWAAERDELLPRLTEAQRQSIAAHIAGVFAQYGQADPAVLAAAFAIDNVLAGRQPQDDGPPDPASLVDWLRMRAGRSRAWAYAFVRQHGRSAPGVLNERLQRRANLRALRALGYSDAAAYRALERRDDGTDARLLPPPRGPRRGAVYPPSAFPLHRAEPGTSIEYADAAGTLHMFAADANGVVQPANEVEARACFSLGLPVADGWPRQA